SGLARTRVSLLWCGRTTSAQLLATPACSSRLISDPAALAAAGPTGLDGADTPRTSAVTVSSLRRSASVSISSWAARLYRPFQHHDFLAMPPRPLLDWCDN